MATVRMLDDCFEAEVTGSVSLGTFSGPKILMTAQAVAGSVIPQVPCGTVPVTGRPRYGNIQRVG